MLNFDINRRLRTRFQGRQSRQSTYDWLQSGFGGIGAIHGESASSANTRVIIAFAMTFASAEGGEVRHHLEDWTE